MKKMLHGVFGETAERVVKPNLLTRYAGQPHLSFSDSSRVYKPAVRRLCLLFLFTTALLALSKEIIVDVYVLGSLKTRANPAYALFGLSQLNRPSLVSLGLAKSAGDYNGWFI